MEITCSLACSYMMMECPRCGFAQPKDRYCASCGLDVDNYVEKPKPFLVRLVQNPDFHLSLIGILIVLAVGYIFYAQRARWSRQVEKLFVGTPLSSRDSADPDAPPPKPQPAAGQVPTDLADINDPPPPAALEAAAVEKVVEKPIELQKLEVSHWEISREALTPLLNTAEKVGEGTAGKAYLWTQGLKVIEAIQASRRLGANRSITLTPGGQLALETPPTAHESFQFGLYFQLAKVDGKDFQVKWVSTLLLPTADAPNEPIPTTPLVKAVTELALNGSANLLSQSVLLLLYEPSPRSLREDYLNKAGEGPWTIFGSEEFRAGTTDWAVLVQLK